MHLGVFYGVFASRHVGRKGSSTGTTRRRGSRVGDARNAPDRQRSQTPNCVQCVTKKNKVVVMEVVVIVVVASTEVEVVEQ